MQTFASVKSESATHSDYVSSADALSVLGVKSQTLYSYVSRGMIRRICVDGKTSLYDRNDVQRLKARSTARSGHGAVAGGAMQWGEPVLVTGITEITDNGPRYRAHLALELAHAGFSFESVAEYLWMSGEIISPAQWNFDQSILRIIPKVTALAGAYPAIHMRQLLTEIALLLSIEESPAHRGPEDFASLTAARTLVQALCASFGFLGRHRQFVMPKENEIIAHYILRAFGIDAKHCKVRALNAALVLLADHEFSPATFAARIAASSGVDLHSCIGAALHVHFGSTLGLRCDRIEQALQEASNASDKPEYISLAQVGPIGFSHPLYAAGDPRAKEIIELALSLKGHAAGNRKALRTLRCVGDHQGTANLDEALVVLCRALGLQGQVAGGLLAISRSAGWIAHVIEQHRQNFMIRPRGKFTLTDEPTNLAAS